MSSDQNILPIPSGKFEGWPWIESSDPHLYDHETNWPKISVITPSLNQAIFLEQTMRSVLMQHYPNLEYIIIDGGSMDGTLELIQRYSSWLTYWSSEPDYGQSNALNKGFKRATGEIFAWINSDDYYEKDTFYKVAKEYMSSPFSFLCGSCLMIDPDGSIIRKLHTEEITPESLSRYWKPHFCPPQPSIFFRGNILAGLGFFNEELTYAMDFDLWLKASEHYQFRVVEDNFSYYRVHLNSKTGSAGGLSKFIPEWKVLIYKRLRRKSFFSLLVFRIKAFRFGLFRKLRRLIANHQQIKYVNA
jgi:glycosyltransferase involved in cell wall biosynthesis